MSKDAPKTVPAPSAPATEPSAPAVPAYVTACPELPAGASVFVLVPADELERKLVLEQLPDALFKYFPDEPKASAELKIARLPYGSVLYVAHCTTVRAKRPDGTYGDTRPVFISKPIDLRAFSAQSQDGYTWSTNLGGVIDAVTGACKHEKGIVWLAVQSGDKESEKRVIKLFKS